MRSSTKRYLLVYDAGCGICTRFKRSIDWLDKYNRLQYCSLNRADEIGLLDSIPPHLRHRSFHMISPNGKLWSGADAIPVVVELLPLGTPTAFLIRNMPKACSVLDFLYTTISRLHDSGSCSYESGRSAAASEPSKILERKHSELLSSLSNLM